MAESIDFSRVILMDKSDGRDDLSRKYAELYLACLAIHCRTGLTLDHPVKSKGRQSRSYDAIRREEVGTSCQNYFE